MTVRILQGDCRDVLATLEPHSVDSIVCDPPYGLTFMGADWDHDVPGPEYWLAAFRVAKPGAPLLAFGGTRTYHRLICAIEDAGWEIRDCLMWVHGQGFPKSLNLQKAGATTFVGYGTALKPAFEPIVLAMKPLDGTFAENARVHGVAGLNIDGARIHTDWSERSEAWKRSVHSAQPDAEKIAAPPGAGIVCHPAGRWPANVLLTHHEDCELLGTKTVRGSAPAGPAPSAGAAWSGDAGFKHVPGSAQTRSRELAPNGVETVENWRCHEDCPVRALDEQSGTLKTGGGRIRIKARGRTIAKGAEAERDYFSPPSEGGASRFFYCGKATKRERGEGNDWPTVKPVALMRYLCRLVKTPTGGIVLDPFMGSGSTGVAAVKEGMSFIGIDREARAIEIATKRIAEAQGSLFARGEAAE